MEARVKCAKAIASTKVKNQLTFMMRIRRKTKEDELSIRDAINKNKKILEDIEASDSIDKLRGYEGIAARNYFQVFARDIIQDWAVFKGRSKNPPRDNVNAVLSFLYTLLYQRIDACIEAEDEAGDMPVRSTRGVLLNENGLRKCIAGFEKKMSTTIISPSTARTVSYFHLIRDQVQLYKRFINGEEANYKPFLYR
jgi:CRISPR/Cas system-associated endonuclease Cas1